MRRTALAVGLAGLALAPAAQANPVSGVARDLAGDAVVAHAARARAASAHDYNGGPVLHSNRTHVIFWQPSGSGLSFEPGYVALTERFLANVAADSHRAGNVYGLSGQYTDSRGPAAYDSSFGGWGLARDPLPQSGCVGPRGTRPGWTVCLARGPLSPETPAVVSSP